MALSDMELIVSSYLGWYLFQLCWCVRLQSLFLVPGRVIINSDFQNFSLRLFFILFWLTIPSRLWTLWKKFWRVKHHIVIDWSSSGLLQNLTGLGQSSFILILLQFNSWSAAFTFFILYVSNYIISLVVPLKIDLAKVCNFSNYRHLCHFFLYYFAFVSLFVSSFPTTC